MNRFHKKKGRLRLLRSLLPVLFFCFLLLATLKGLSSVSAAADREEAARLQDAVLRGAVQCYALEGFYPDSLAYLEEHYGITYDKDRYVVSYEVIGSNLMPDVAVIPLYGRGTGL